MKEIHLFFQYTDQHAKEIGDFYDIHTFHSLSYLIDHAKTIEPKQTELNPNYCWGYVSFDTNQTYKTIRKRKSTALKLHKINDSHLTADQKKINRDNIDKLYYLILDIEESLHSNGRFATNNAFATPAVIAYTENKLKSFMLLALRFIKIAQTYKEVNELTRSAFSLYITIHH